MTHSFRITLLCSCLLAAPAARAIVNMADVHTGEFAEGFQGSAALSIDGARGNTDKDSVSVGSTLQWRDGERLDVLLMNYGYGQSGGETDTRKAFLHGRHIEQFRPTRAWETYAQLQSDEFARLSLRALLGGGLRFNPPDQSGSTRLFFGAGAFYEHERLEDDTAASGETRRLYTWRASLYLILAHRFNAQTRLTSTTYYQPALDEPGDYRLLEQAALKVKMTDSLDLKLSINIGYDSEPPASVDKTDVSYSTGFELRF